MKKYYLAVRRNVDNFVKNSCKTGKDGGKLGRNVEKPVDNWSEKVDFLRKNGRENRSEIVGEKTAGAKKAVLRYRILKTSKERELTEIRLITGRHHQIRVQMAGMGTPLAGDRKYGIKNKDVDSVDKSYPALCAYHLEFVHPKTQKTMTFQIEPENAAFIPFFPLPETSG